MVYRNGGEEHGEKWKMKWKLETQRGANSRHYEAVRVPPGRKGKLMEWTMDMDMETGFA